MGFLRNSFYGELAKQIAGGSQKYFVFDIEPNKRLSSIELDQCPNLKKYLDPHYAFLAELETAGLLPQVTQFMSMHELLNEVLPSAGVVVANTEEVRAFLARRTGATATVGDLI